MLCFHSYKRFSRAAFLRLFAEWSRRRHKHTENVWVVPTIYMMRFTDFVEWKRDLWCEKCIHTIGKASSPFFLFFFFIFAVNKITYRQWVVYVVWSSSGELKRRVRAALYEYIWHTGISIPHFISPKWNRNGLENARIDLDYAMFRYPEWNHRESSMSPMKRINARR